MQESCCRRDDAGFGIFPIVFGSIFRCRRAAAGELMQDSESFPSCLAPFFAAGELLQES